MEFFCGLDVGMDETAICVVDDKGKVMLEAVVVTDPEAIKSALKPYLSRLRRVGHEAGSLSPWLHPELLRLGLPAVCDVAAYFGLTSRRWQSGSSIDVQGGSAGRRSGRAAGAL